MTPIDKDDLFKHISDYFQSKGVELKDGPYKQGIEKGCTVMAEVANSSRDALEKAKVQLDKTLDRVRQTIHEKTAPKPAASASTGPKPEAPKPAKAAVTEVVVAPPKTSAKAKAGARPKKTATKTQVKRAK